MMDIIMREKGMPSVTIETDTPDGVMYTTIMEGPNGIPIKINVTIGKAGLAITAWSKALSETMSLALECGAGINDLITILSSQTSSSAPRTLRNGEKVRSGPEGICIALMQYRGLKYNQLRATLEGDSDDFSGPSINS